MNFRWIKINTGGSIRGNLEAKAGIATDHQGDFWGAFAVNLRVYNVLKVELLSIMIVIEEANRQG